MIKVYCMRITEEIEKGLFNNLKQYLEEEKQEIVTNYSISRVKTEAVVSDIFKRLIICNETGIRNKDIILDRNEYGKPYLKNLRDFHFNVSHSGEWIVCATHRLPVGIDLEHIAPIDFDIAKNNFSKNEYNDLMKKDNVKRLPFFYELWTFKESYVKAVGKGLSIPLDSFSLKVNKDRAVLGHYFFKQYFVSSSYKLAVCGLSDDFPYDFIVSDFKTICEKFF